MKKKLMIALPVLLLVLGGVYKFALASPAPVPKKKIDGEVYVLPKDFLVNTSDGKFAKVNVALVIDEGSAAPAAGGGEEAAAAPPEGFGTMPQEAAVRDIITNTLSDVSGSKIIKRSGREKLKRKHLQATLTKPAAKAHDVLSADVAPQ